MRDRESSKLTYAIESRRESPVVKRIMQKMIRNTIGKRQVGVLRAMKSTTVSGTNPIMKLTALEIEADAAKISGRT